jgi:hypothetical protein
MKLGYVLARVCRVVPLLAAASLLVLLSACSKSEPTEAEMRQAVEAKIADAGLHFSGFSQFTKLHCIETPPPYDQPWPQNNNQPIGHVYICSFHYLTNGVRHNAGAQLTDYNVGIFSDTGYFGSSWRFYETAQNLAIMFF